MLQSINDRIQGWLGWVIVAFITVPFALWGIQSYLDVGGNAFVAKVNDTEISTAQFDRALAQQRSRLQQMFGKNMPKSDAYDKVLKQQVINQLVTTEALNQYTNKSGYTVADATLAQTIASIDAFKENGVFSQDLYEKVLNSQGMSIAGFEAMYRQELATSQIQNTIMASAFSTDAEVSNEHTLKNQQRNISYVEFKSDDFLKKSAVTEEEVKQYFQENAFRYMNPEQVSIQYIELKSEQLENEVPVNEADIKKSYEAYVANAKTNEQRKARHILVNLASDASADEKKLADEKINRIEKELAAGGDFAELAKKYSDDEGSAANGGDLGLVTKGMMVKPFEDALFGLSKGLQSKVVRSEFGYHIIKLDDIQSAKYESFENKKAGIEKELKESAVQNLFYERAEMLANLAYENPESLDLAAEQLRLPIKKTDFFTRTNGQQIAENAKVRSVAFEDSILKEKLNSDAIEITNKHVVVIRINEHKPATSKEFEQVKSAISAELKANKAKQLATDNAADLIARMKTDSSKANWIKISSEFKAATTALNMIKRDSDKADKQLIQAAFKLSAPEKDKISFDQVALGNGNSAVVVVSTVVTPAFKSDKSAINTAAKQLSGQIANREFSAVVAAIKDKTDIFIPTKINE